MKTAYLQGIAFALVVTIAGCGEKSLPAQKTYPVQGKVTIKGEPVAFATITFTPKGGQGAPATAYTDKDGVFAGARTYSNTNEMDGMVPGEYEVHLEAFDPISSVKFMGTRPEGDEKPTKIPREMTNPGTSYKVDADDNNNINIDL